MCTGAQAQTPDSTDRRRPPADSLATARSRMMADSMLQSNDSLFYTRFKQNMYKRRLTRQLYDALFRDVYNSRSRTGEVSTIDANPFAEFEGRVIGTIHIRRLDVFGQSVYDTLRQSRNWVERVASSLHANTREGIIRRSFLLIREGDLVDPDVLKDNERLLRTTPIFHDARILVVPRPGSRQFVDVYVITQDVWSLLPGGGFGGLNNFSIELDQRNFRGVAHQLYNRFSYNTTRPGQKVEYQGRYAIPYVNILGVRTFLTAQADFIYLRDIKQMSFKLYRPFITPDTKYAGSLELNNTRLNSRYFDERDSARFVGLNYNFLDIWIGRAFRVNWGGSDALTRNRLVIAGRVTRYEYLDRPPVTADSNQLYQNSRTALFSVGYSQRRYVRDVLIYGFGRTEDVPIGSLVSFVGGIDNAELGERLYTGFNFSRGQYLRNIGYLYGLVNVGGYYRSAKVEQGVFSVIGNYFSPLHKTTWGNMRHFLNVRLTYGTHRFNNEFIMLSGREGIGINNDALRGTKRLLIGYENVLFSKLDVAGFRVAIVTFANFGLVSYPNRLLVQSPLYQAYGIGFRFRNENLAFNSFQFRLAYYPNIPNNRNEIRYNFEGISGLRFRDFDIAAPEIVPFR
ncbi:hypothetical protein F5984_13885 [Rudanella paleaurantiibacter]|uniref:BamA/TamA family outer membrane protein n=1 Tax=Rudanella paleaurantiibacter TaxID=2614655 RepID=A0A7J5TZY7_9BACT|nr:hypothetical protein [Rudanella paleaurantiibacter]KAB7730507.1 hypothetical protein F5984_13885 [Rudanella paleaurantiibacter]